MTHKRSKEKELERKVRRLVLVSSFHDRILCETVCRMSRAEVLALLDEPVEVGLVPELEKGEVLTDSRGRGTFQRAGLC
jgi:hypothetical protein